LINFAATQKKLEKMKSDHITRKYKLAMRIYNLIQLICMQQPDNQEYAAKFVHNLISHLGYGRFVSKTLIEIFKNNEKLLYTLHKIIMHTAGHTHNSMILDSERKTFLTAIVHRIKEFKQYEKDDILDLLKSVCLYNNQAIYINQDKIFKMIYEDPLFRSTQLLELTNKNNQVNLQIRGTSYRFEQFFKSDDASKYQKEIRFLKSQLDLYATLCLNRNYSSSKAFGKIFSFQNLINYIENKDIPEDIRAILVKLLATIHIDKEPRTVQERPNLVKIVELNPEQIEQKFGLKALLGQSKRQDKGRGKTNVLNQDIKPQVESLDHNIHLYVDEEEAALNINGEEINEDLLGKLKAFILNYLKEKSEQAEKNQPSKIIYTQFTLEIVKLTVLMLKFGMFKTRVAKQEDKGNVFGALGAFAKGVLSDAKSQETEKTTSDIEQLVKFLTPLLEYDEAYVDAMKTMGVKRSKIIV